MMTLKEAVKARHSVRSYQDVAIPDDVADKLKGLIAECNATGNLHMQLITDEPEAFNSRMAHYGKFSGVKNYIALAGPKGGNLDERLGYYGARVTLLAQQLGLNTCWVGMTYSKIPGAVALAPGEKLCAVIAVGYGISQGTGHKIKTFGQVTDLADDAPGWFRDGVEAALLAPTAMNQQKFKFGIDSEGRVTLKSGLGFFAKMDLGIVRCFFEAGAAPAGVSWAETL